MIKIKAVQENPKVGDIKGNTALIEKYLVSADKEKIDLLIFSEMFLSGYPPEDLVMRDDFLEEITKSIEHITSLSKETSLIFGAPLQPIIINIGTPYTLGLANESKGFIVFPSPEFCR